MRESWRAMKLCLIYFVEKKHRDLLIALPPSFMMLVEVSQKA